jgi:hypothetical protein
MEKHKRLTEYLKNKANQKKKRHKQFSAPVPVPPRGRGSCSLHLKVSQTVAATDWQTQHWDNNYNPSAGMLRDSNFPLLDKPSAKQDNPSFSIPQRTLARCHLKKGPPD